MNNNSNKFKIYAFSNENLTSLKSLFSFDNATVLSVLGSGDQYFTAKLYGAKEVELFEINPDAYYHFVLKFMAIKHLSFDDFYYLFVKYRLQSISLLKKILPLLPSEVANKIISFLKTSNNPSEFLIYSPISDNVLNYQTGRIIPYLDHENYYKLQSILKKSNLPTIHETNFFNLPSKVENKSFDILLSSNIYTWNSMNAEDFANFLRKFNATEIEAVYTWNKGSAQRILEESDSFNLSCIESVSLDKKDPNDYILTLKR